MTHVTKHATDSEDYRVAFNELARLLTKLNKRTAPHFLNELLTESERIMLIKRFAAIFMFNQGYSAYRASEVMGISISTAVNYRTQYSMGKFSNLLSCFTKKEQNRFLLLIQDIIMAQVSPRARARMLGRVL